MGKKVSGDVNWVLHFATQNASFLYNVGVLTRKGAEEWLEVEARVRARMLRKGKRWSEARIKRKVRARVALRRLWSLGKASPWKPFGGALITAGESLDALAKSLQPSIEKELNGG